MTSIWGLFWPKHRGCQKCFPWALRLASYRCIKQCIQSRNNSISCRWSHCTSAALTPSSNPNVWPLDCRPWHHHQCAVRLLSPSRSSHAAMKRNILLCSKGVIVLPALSRKLWASCAGRCWTIPIQPRPATMWPPCVQPYQDALKACRFGSDEGVKALAIQWFQGVLCRGVPSAGAAMDACLPHHPWGQFWWPLLLCSGQSLNGFHFKKWPHAVNNVIELLEVLCQYCLIIPGGQTGNSGGSSLYRAQRADPCTRPNWKVIQCADKCHDNAWRFRHIVNPC
jgi:hypothetical protein